MATTSIYSTPEKDGGQNGCSDSAVLRLQLLPADEETTPMTQSPVCSIDESDCLDPVDVLNDSQSTDVSTNGGRGKPEQDLEAKRMARRSRTIQDLRENQMKCLEALRKGQRAATIAMAFRQTSEPALRRGASNTCLSNMSKQVSEETPSDNDSELSGFASCIQDSNGLVTDPLVAVVKGINAHHGRQYEALLANMLEAQRESAQQRKELRSVLQQQAEEIDALKAGSHRTRGTQVAKTFAAAFGAALGASHYAHHLWKGASAHQAGSAAKGHGCAAPKGSTLVLPQKPAGWSLAMEGVFTPRGARKQRSGRHVV
mmetsp:Transcript_95410/g.221443  ORF Transcript_95410/g.221443 Transcript_95410/m.221443 type:complete len:315 (+) Transcript_95410:160-1104(+)